MLEKNIKIDFKEHDLMGAENRTDAYLAKNPGGQLPALELDDGQVIAETVVICDYLEDLHPDPALMIYLCLILPLKFKKKTNLPPY